MMDLLESDNLKVRILKGLARESNGLSLNGLKKKVKAANFRSIKRNCDFLELADLITMDNLLKIERKRINPQNYRLVKITPQGRKVLNKL